MLAPTANRNETLQYTVHYKRVVLVAHCDQVSMAGLVAGKFLRAVRLGDIDADRATSDPFDHFVHFETLHTKNPQITVIACGDYPVLSALLTHSECDNVVDLGAIEAQNHVWIDFFGLVLEISEDVV